MQFNGKLTPDMRRCIEIKISNSLLKFSGHRYITAIGFNDYDLYIYFIPLQENGFDWLKNHQAVSIAISFATPFVWIRAGINWHLKKGAIMFYSTVYSPIHQLADTTIEEFYQYDNTTKLFEFSGVYEDGERIQKGYPEYFEPGTGAWEFVESADAYYKETMA